MWVGAWWDAHEMGGPSSLGPDRKGQCEDSLGTEGQGALWDSQAGWRPPGSPPHVLSPGGEGHWREDRSGPCAEAASGARGGGRGPEPGEPQTRLHEAWALPNRKAPRTLMPVSTSAPGLPLNRSQTPASAPAVVPPWARWPAPAPVGAPLLASAPITALPAPARDLGWRRAELLHQSTERSRSSTRHGRSRPERGVQGQMRPRAPGMSLPDSRLSVPSVPPHFCLLSPLSTSSFPFLTLSTPNPQGLLFPRLPLPHALLWVPLRLS